VPAAFYAFVVPVPAPTSWTVTAYDATDREVDSAPRG
jgi:hypothetical protein